MFLPVRNHSILKRTHLLTITVNLFLFFFAVNIALALAANDSVGEHLIINLNVKQMCES